MQLILDKCRDDIKKNGDVSYSFLQILSYGEKTIKVIILGFIASINEGVNRRRNALERSALKATALGNWIELIDRISETSPLMRSVALADFREIMEECDRASWQYEAVDLLNNALNILLSSERKLRKRVTLKQWFELYVQLRNKTRGHGSISTSMQKEIAEIVFKSIEIVRSKLSVLNRQWAYLRKTQKQKFHVQGLSDEHNIFNYLSTSKGQEYTDLQEGVYIFWDKPVLVNLIKFFRNEADELFEFDRDFTYPNDKWRQDNTYEAVSFHTGRIYYPSCHEYEIDPVYLPPSETDPLGEFGVIGDTYTNMPERRKGYVKRQKLESELLEELYKIDTHTVISLIGRGGIGKTWLTLAVAHRIAENGSEGDARFGCIVWFSARDVDLTEDGFNLVKPSSKNLQDISRQYANLIYIDDIVSKKKNIDVIELLGNHMTHGYNEFPGPILFIFDNFETIDDKAAVYSWLENSVRNPNKILITSREHAFRADYPIEILGMEKDEFDEMILKRCNKHNYQLAKHELVELYETTSGHPYIANLMLSYRIKTGDKEPSKLIVRNPDVFRMLFDRSFNRLSKEAQQLFLVLGNWNSGYADYAIIGVFEAIETNDADWNAALDELENLSLIESEALGNNGNRCYFLPIAAQLFCRQKIRLGYSYISLVPLLQELRKFGVISESSLKDDCTVFLSRYLKHYTSIQSTIDLSIFIKVVNTISLLCPKLSLVIYSTINHLPHISQGFNMRNLIENYLHSCKISSEFEKGWLALMDFLDRDNAPVELFNLVAAALENELTSIQLASCCGNLCNKYKRQFAEIDEELCYQYIEKIYGFLIDRTEELSADDLSRLAWLAINKHEQDRVAAKALAEQGLVREPNNNYCRKILEKL